MDLKGFESLVKNLLPSGRVWNRSKDSTLTKFSKAISLEYWRVHERIKDLIRELNPGTSNELLEEWERLTGLPDNCQKNVELSLFERQSEVLAKIRNQGGQDKQFYIDQMKAKGFDIEITEFSPFQAGLSAAGDSLSNDLDWRFTWEVRMEEVARNYFSADVSAAGDPLRVFGNEALECFMNHLKPAHTNLIFSYYETEL